MARIKWVVEYLKERTCPVCDSKFEVTFRQRKKKYCSNKCGSRARNRKFRQENPDKVKDSKFRQKQDWSKLTIPKLRYRANKRGLEFNIEPCDLIIPEICPVLGIKIERKINVGSGYWDNSPSVDRIDPNKGYIKGNVRVISHRANLLKSNASIDELRLVLKDLESISE
jgi:hypothetical protein